FVSICAPLRGTHFSRFAPTSHLRALAPGSALFEQLEGTAPRLERWRGALLTIASRRDLFVTPPESALLPGYAETLMLEETGHVASLFDRRVHAVVRALLTRLAPE